MRRFKKGLIGVLLIVFVLSLAACGGGSTNDSAGSSATDSGGQAASGGESTATEAPKEKVVLEYWHTYSDTEEKVLTEQIKPLFEKEHPNIELKLTRMPYEGLKQQVISGVAGDAAPDLMRMDIIWVPEFAKMGALKKLDDLDGFADVKSSVFESPMQTNIFEGSYYGVPLDTNTKVAIYNKQLLTEAGLTEPPKTMDQLAEASKTLVAKGHKGGIGIGGANSWGILPYFWSLGGKLTSDDYTKVDGYLNSPESIKALEQIVQWKKDGLLAPTILGEEPGTWDGIKNNDYLMIDDGPWFYSILMNDESGFKPLEQTVRGLIPEGPGGSLSVVGGEDLVMFANSKHPNEAWTFMKWMLGDEPQKIMSQTGQVPTNINAANDPEFLKVPFIKEFVDQLQTALPRTPIPQWGEMESVFNLEIEKAIRGELSPQDALNEAASQIEAILKQ